MFGSGIVILLHICVCTLLFLIFIFSFAGNYSVSFFLKIFFPSSAKYIWRQIGLLDYCFISLLYNKPLLFLFINQKKETGSICSAHKRENQLVYLFSCHSTRFTSIFIGLFYLLSSFLTLCRLSFNNCNCFVATVTIEN